MQKPRNIRKHRRHRKENIRPVRFYLTERWCTCGEVIGHTLWYNTRQIRETTFKWFIHHNALTIFMAHPVNPCVHNTIRASQKYVHIIYIVSASHTDTQTYLWKKEMKQKDFGWLIRFYFPPKSSVDTSWKYCWCVSIECIEQNSDAVMYNKTHHTLWAIAVHFHLTVFIWKQWNKKSAVKNAAVDDSGFDFRMCS